MGIQLQLEVTNVCNSDCVFCPYSVQRRPQGTMPMPLFRKIVDEAVTIPSIELITLTGLGEPLLDRHLIERIRYIRTQLPKIRIDLYTNGSYLRKKVADDLVEVGLSVLYVSLNATHAEQRKEIMKVDDYDRVVEQIAYAQAAGAGKMRVIVKGVVSKDLMEPGDSDRFVEQWNGPWDQPNGSAFLHLEGNWAGSTGQKMRTTPRQACSRALGQVMVLWDGRVSLCCFDAHGEVILGDLNTQTIREMYAGPTALGIREAHVNGQRSTLPLCATCTSI